MHFEVDPLHVLCGNWEILLVQNVTDARTISLDCFVITLGGRRSNNGDFWPYIRQLLADFVLLILNMRKAFLGIDYDGEGRVSRRLKTIAEHLQALVFFVCWVPKHELMCVFVSNSF